MRWNPPRPAYLLLLIATIGGARPAHAQSRSLGWLAWLEEWSAEEDYRGWILHGAIAALVTFAADRIADRPEYGAVAASGFYLGKELREAYHWDGLSLDRIMDTATPIATSVATAYLLRGKRQPKPVPPPLPAAAPPLPPADSSAPAARGDTVPVPLPACRPASLLRRVPRC